MSKKNFKYSFDKLEPSANSAQCHFQVILWQPLLKPRFYEGHLSSTVLGGSGLWTQFPLKDISPSGQPHWVRFWQRGKKHVH